MGEAIQFVLYEHAVGYALLRINEFEDAGQIIAEVQESIADPARFCSIVKLEAFDPFKNTEAAFDNCNAISEGLVHADLMNFLEQNVPRAKKKKHAVIVGVGDSKLAGAISEAFEGQVRTAFTGPVPEILRGIRMHFARLAKDLPHHSLSKAQLSLGHSYSRGKVKFDVHRVDNMVIQSIALLDQLDKDVNLFGMRIREWYSYHFPELFKLIPDQYKYVKCATVIMDRKNLNDETLIKVNEIIDDEEKLAEIAEAARTSMGMDISPMDMLNIERFGARVIALTEYRQKLHAYIKDRMHSCAPSLSALIGEQVGARLISRAGSLTNLAKYPASTVQILGAEKALFRALKTRSNTPKYGLLFHSTFIGRAAMKNKGRISRFLANKCSIASRIDCFSEVPVATFGEHLRKQVEDRLKYFETGDIPAKNLDVMHLAEEEAVGERHLELRRRKKAAKRARRTAEAAELAVAEQQAMDVTQGMSPTKKVKKEKTVEVVETMEGEPPVKKTKKMRETVEATLMEEEPSSGKKKKHKAALLLQTSKEEFEEDDEQTAGSEKKKKKHKLETIETVQVVDTPMDMTELVENLSSSGKKSKKSKKAAIEQQPEVAFAIEAAESPKKKKKK